ncbi:MAG: hypothetical protein ACJAZN_002548 [Planctomycetota bacterium]|jgi:hypothetical protein
MGQAPVVPSGRSRETGSPRTLDSRALYPKDTVSKRHCVQTTLRPDYTASRLHCVPKEMGLLARTHEPGSRAAPFSLERGTRLGRRRERRLRLLFFRLDVCLACVLTESGIAATA